MKKVFFLLSLLACQRVYAQQRPHSLEAGLNAGVSLSSIRNAKSPFSTLSPRVGSRVSYAGSVSIKYRFTPHLALQTMIGYEQKGATLHADEKVNTEQLKRETTFDRKVENDYVTIPLLLTWQSTGRLSVGAGGGGSIAVVLRSGISGSDFQSQAKYATLPNGAFTPIEGYTVKSNFRADGLERTRRMDYGCAVVGFVSYAVSDKVSFSIHSSLNASLRKLDKQYDNESIVIPQPGGFAKFQMDYFGLNSRAKNINLLMNAGLSYKLF
jgi:hypothetical protein